MPDSDLINLSSTRAFVLPKPVKMSRKMKGCKAANPNPVPGEHDTRAPDVLTTPTRLSRWDLAVSVADTITSVLVTIPHQSEGGGDRAPPERSVTPSGAMCTLTVNESATFHTS